MVVTSVGLTTTVVYNCTELGQTNISLVITLDGRYLPLHIVWTKRVGGSRPGFNVGTNATLADVVQDGVTMYIWDPRFHSVNMSVETTSVTFYVYISVRKCNLQPLQISPKIQLSFNLSPHFPLSFKLSVCRIRTTLLWNIKLLVNQGLQWMGHLGLSSPLMET